MRPLAFTFLAAAACGQLRFGPPPRIEAFTADAAEVGSGERVALRWRVSQAGSYELSGVGAVGESGTVVRPASDAEYVLTATGLGGSVSSAPLHVRVRASLALAVGADDAHGTRLLVRVRTARGEPPASDVLVRVEAPARGVVEIPCPAGRRTCSTRIGELAIGNAPYRASAVLDGTTLSATAFAEAAPVDKPRNVRASLRDGAVQVSWDAVHGAVGYSAALFDLDSRAPAGEPATTEGTVATLELGAMPLDRAAVVVEAWTAFEPGDGPLAVARGIGFVSAGAQGGTGGGWQLFGPEEFAAGELRVSFPRLVAGERLAVIAVNAGGPDGAQLAARTSGLANPDPGPPAATALSVAFAAPAASVHDEVRTRQDVALIAALGSGLPRPGATAASASPASFCIARGLDFGNRVRKAVVRALETDHAVFFVDREDAAEVPPGFIEQLGAIFEDRIYPVDRVVFGEESDVDRNGKLFVVLSHELGAHLNGGWLLGYFGNNDLLRTRDDSRDCGGSGSNQADIIYLNSIGNAAANGYGAAQAGADLFPATLAHELQHLVNLNQRCLQRRCDGPEETWINEGLSKLAEDLAGFGWNGAQGRWEGAQYLARGGDRLLGYSGRSLTLWEGDPIGNYQGAHSFLRYFADRAGPAFPAAVAKGVGGARGIEDALGLPLPRAMAEWASALLFSGEAASPAPRFSYLGAAWSPLHDRLRRLDWQGLGADGTAVALRTDGLGILLSGAAFGGPAEVWLRSDESVPPHVVVARFPGNLPR